jgi:hypothetical protein
MSRDRIKEKAKKYKEQGFADTEYRDDENKIIMKLPKNVMEQHKLLILAESVITKTNSSYDEIVSLEERYYNAISKNILVDGVELSEKIKAGNVSVSHLLSYGILYYAELLSPLTSWRDIIATELLKMTKI